MFDTLKLARRLEQAGFTREQASGAAEALADTFSEGIATRSDIAEMRAELKGDIAELRAEFKTELAMLDRNLRGEIANVRGEVAALRSSTAQWIISAVFVNLLSMVGLVVAVWQLAHK